MKNKFYASLFIGIGLNVAVHPSLAKTAQPPAKKQVSNAAAKPAKANAHTAISQKPELSSTKKTPANTLVKQNSNQSKNHQLADARDSKHDKTKSHQLEADTKGKHDKSKAHQLAAAEDNKHGKSKNHPVSDNDDNKHGQSKAHQLADAKDDKHGKHGKSKDQQLADARDKKHHSRKSQHTVDDSDPEESDDEDASTAVEIEEPAHGETVASTQSPANELAPSYKVENEPLAPAKSSPLFFQPLDKNADQLFSEPTNKPKNLMPSQMANNHYEAKNTAPFIAAPSRANSQIASNSRVHTLLDNGTRSTITSNTSDEENASSEEDTDALIQPNHDNKRIHSSLGYGKVNNIINNAVNNETSARVASTHGVIDSSLDAAGEKAGLSNDMIIELADVFAWDIDFANNLEVGDQFTLIYEEGTGNAGNRIIAAQFINRGKTHTAIRYKDKEGMVSYYTPDGRSLRKAFLSTPIDYARVSSHFDPHRMHPILNRIRAHKGVDYAARIGTPVKAAGDGVVTFHGNKGAYGRMIVIAHGEHYETAYAHLSDFRQDLQDGEPVKQGDVIGYVGQSGLATGPHLHYEFRVDGEHRDPEKLDSKQAMRLPNGIWEDFHSQTIPVLTQLNQAKSNTLVAKNP